MASSSVILLCMLKAVPGVSVQAKLDVLYDSFVDWCRTNGKSSSIENFTLLKFKMKTLPGLSVAKGWQLGTHDIDVAYRIKP